MAGEIAFIEILSKIYKSLIFVVGCENVLLYLAFSSNG